MGPSGSGKTTLLRLISGLETLSHGQIEIYEKTVANSKFSAPSNERNVGHVFQEKILFPHLSILNNVKFGITGHNDFRNKRALEFLSLFKVSEIYSFPNNLSGGEQQRVAIARAIAPRPSVVAFG